VGESQRISTTVVIPAYNEEAGLPVVLEQVVRVADGCWDVLVVDDGSTDGTADAALRYPCRLVRHEVNMGKAEALRSGIRNAIGDKVIFIDGDGTYPPEAIPRMAAALDNYDIVYASRFWGRENIPGLNRIGSFIFQTLMTWFYRFGAHDYCTGLYGGRKSCLVNMRLDSSGFAIEPEIAAKASRMRLRIFEVEIEYSDRIGPAKLSAIKAGYMHLKTILRLALWHPKKLQVGDLPPIVVPLLELQLPDSDNEESSREPAANVLESCGAESDCTLFSTAPRGP
jgi:glycosyltransferase involved in cell wall biosynthesis